MAISLRANDRDWTAARVWGLRFLGVAALVLLDQWSKGAVFAWLEPGHRRQEILGRGLAFWTSCNPGAAFGQLVDHPHLLVLGRGVAVLLLSWLLLRAPARARLTLFAMVLVLAGAIGNLIDNLWTGCTVPGHPYFGVRDFIDVYYEPFLGIDKHFETFNVADACISIGACAWVLAGFKHETHEEPAVTAPREGAETPPAQS